MWSPYAPATLDDLLDAAAARWEVAAAVKAGGRVLSYRELRSRVLICAQQWHRDGLAPGDRMVVVGRPSIEVLVQLFAAARLGLVGVLTGDRLTPERVAHVVRHSGARLVLADDRAARRLSGQDLGDAVLTGAAPSGSSATDREALPPPPIGRDLALLIYTSGSTGDPKGVMLTHDNLIAGARIVARYLDLRESDRVLSALPWSFDAGLNQVLSTFYAGGTVVLPRSNTVADLSRSLRDDRITALAGVPTLWDALVSHGSPFPRLELPDLRLITTTGGILAGPTLTAIRRAHPETAVYLMYGLTEAFRSTYLPPELVDQHPTSIGRPIPETQLLILDETGRRCQPGQVGELVHRGPTVAAGYFNDPEATAAVFRPYPFAPPGGYADLVVYSGDYVRQDDDGLLYFVERRDEQFKSLGFRAGPTEIEREILDSGLVAEVVVVAREKAGSETDIAAVVVPGDPGTFTADLLLKHCRTALPRHLRPTRVVVVADLPRTSSGKLDRTAVRAATP